ncbi:MAG: metal-dependent hydrolase [Candidatus Lokiarchaeota archaeon]|nr:metal-dependent hydrolase [Candidatus Lokiarchaeota archaeon]
MAILIKHYEGNKIYPIFHAALPLVFTEIPQIKKLKINRLSLLIGSLLPDIIDKPLFLLGLGNGRFLSHNLLFMTISFLIVYFSSKRNKNISFPFLAGLIFHLILDIPYVPLFYPFISYEFHYLEEPLLYWLRKLWTDPFVFITEITGLLIMLFILIKNKLYHKKEISDYLRGVNQTFTKSSKEIEIDA